MKERELGADSSVSWSYYIIPSGHAHAHVDCDGDIGGVGKDEFGLREGPLSPPHLGQE